MLVRGVPVVRVVRAVRVVAFVSVVCGADDVGTVEKVGGTRPDGMLVVICSCCLRVFSVLTMCRISHAKAAAATSATMTPTTIAIRRLRR